MESNSPILGLQPRDMAAMLVIKTVTITSTNLHENGVYIPQERNAFFLGHQLARHDVTCKPIIGALQWGIVVFRPATRHQVSTQHQFRYHAAPFTLYPNRPRHTLLISSSYIHGTPQKVKKKCVTSE